MVRLEKVPGPFFGRGLEATPVSNLDPTYHTPLKAKHTCELVAAGQAHAGEFHVLERPDVAWGSGDGGKAWGEMKKVPGKVLWTRP